MDEYLKENNQEWRVSSCALSTTWTRLPLLSKTAHTQSSAILEFGLPKGFKTLSLPTCGVVMVRVPKAREGKAALEKDLAAYEELLELARSAESAEEKDELEDEALRELERWAAAEAAAAKVAEGGDDDSGAGGLLYAQRPYTPVSPETLPGRFQLLVRRYDAWGDPAHPLTYRPPGHVSNHLHNLKVGEAAEFRHVAQNIKLQYPFKGVSRLNLVCVGSGVAPMVQIMDKVLSTPGDTTQVCLVYGNRAEEDIMMRRRLEALSWRYPKRVKLVYCIGSRYDIDKSRPGVKQKHSGLGLTRVFGGAPVREKGWVTADVLERHLHPPAGDAGADVDNGGRTLTLVAGLPRVYETLCGPRDQKKVTGALSKLGWTHRDVVKL